MLTAFGTFWAGEGIGIEWTLEDGMLVGLVALYAAVAFAFVAIYRKRPSKRIVPAEPVTP